MADRIGSLATGKQADIAVMSLGPLAMWPVHDPVATVVMQGSGARVRDVLVAGRFAKRNGKLVCSDVDGVRARLAASGERILSRLDVKSISREIAAVTMGGTQ
jgi:5-methylthioadenosine/S-adenosylhomocysteine deaminase